MDQFADDPGVGWHLKTGEYVVLNRAVPVTEPFLASTAPRTWIADQWLSDTALYLLYHAGSWPLVYGILTVIFLFTFWWILFQHLSNHRGLYLYGVIATFFAFRAGNFHFILRPVLFSFLLFTFTYIQASKFFIASEDRAKPFVTRSVLTLAGVFTLWANMHPSFVLGLLLLAAMALATFLERGSLRSLLKVLLITGVVLLATLINPYGYKLYGTFLNSSQWLDVTSEWQPLALKSFGGELLVGSIVLISSAYLVSIEFRRELRRRVWRFDAILVLAFGLASLKAVRILPYYALVTAPLLGAALKAWLNFLASKAKAPISNSLIRVIMRADSVEKGSIGSITTLSLITALVLLLAYFRQTVPLYAGFGANAYGPSPQRFPIAALMHLTTNHTGSAKVIVATPNWGGAVTWYGAGKVRALLDDRDILFERTAYTDFFQIFEALPENDTALKDYLRDNKADYLLIEANHVKLPYLKSTPLLKVIYQDEVSVLFSAK